MHGVKLETKALYVTITKQHIEDLVTIIAECGIEVKDVIASPIAESKILLSEKNKMAGCALLNIGYETTTLAVYEEGLLISLQSFHIGGMDITKDIALGFKISLDDAENIKNGVIIGDYPKKKLDEIIQARVYDMFEIIESHLKKIGKNAILPAGIFITGGGSNIASIEELARATLKLPSRIASLNLNDRGKIMDSTWSVAYGLTVIGLSGLDSSDFNQNFGKGLFKKYLKPILSWFKQFLP
jgi:cell division protein FtsA